MMYCSLDQQHQVITSLCGVFVQVVVMLVFCLILIVLVKLGLPYHCLMCPGL